jgi:hypothetical protein
MAQIARAILLANATATSIFGFLPSMRASHDPAAIDLRPSQLNRDIAPIISNRRMSNWPAFETRPSRSLPPEECCRGTSPTQAAKSRILFLVDRRALGKQTSDALETTEIDGLLNFAQIYKVAGSETKVPEDEDQVQVATVQSLIARILNEPDPAKRPTPGTFDCIIVDEAHRGYTLDAELRETDIGFRNLDDYQSAYRQILDYFDAVKVALTATPALHTREIFGRPVFHYGYRQAVVEGYLNDHLPPKRITMATVQGSSLSASSARVACLTRRRRTTRSSASRTAILLRFLPRSIPRVTMVIGSLLPLKHTGIILRSRREGRAIP